MTTKKYLFLVLSLVLLFSASSTFATRPSDSGLKEGDLISAIFSSDPDVYIVNDHGYKRLFLNPEIFKFYKHLGGFASVKLVTTEVRDSFPTSGLFRNCEDKDDKVYGIDVEGEDQGELRWINTSGDQAVKDDPNFFKKVFCINKKEFDWYPKATVTLNSVKEVPQYDRSTSTEARVSTQEKIGTKAELKIIGQAVICHYPPGNITAFQTLTVGASALRAHLDHGDTIGACLSSLPTPSPAFTITPTPAVSVPSVPIASSSNPFTPNLTPLVTITPTPTPAIIPTSPITAPTSSSPSPNSSASFTPTPSPTSTSSSAPQSPTSVTISSGTGKITVSWTASASRYNIYFSLNNGAYSFWATNQIETFFDYSNVSSGNVYRFKIYGCNSDSVTCSTTGTESNALTYGSSTPTLTPTPTPIPIPTPPSSVTASSLYNSLIRIIWSSSADKYLIRRSVRADNYATWSSFGNLQWSKYNGLTTAPDTAYDDFYVLQGYQYRYRVYGCDSTGSLCSTEGTESNMVIHGATLTPTPTPTPTPVPPQGFTTQLQNGTNVWMYWYAVSGATTYRAERFTSGSPAWVTIAEVGGISTNYTDVGLAPGTHYYHVRACNSSGCSNISNETIVSIVSLSTPTPAPTATVSFDNFSRNHASVSEITITRDLYQGTTGNDVKQLQALLVNEVNYPVHLITGYFGTITREAVKRLQEKYGVKPVSGYFGAITRRVLNK